MKVVAIIPAGGSGVRFGAEQPKQYLALGQYTVLEHTILRCAAAATITEIVVAVAADHIEQMQHSLPAVSPKVRAVVAGGATRQASVVAGLRAVEAPCAFVAVHDAARPMVDPADIDHCVHVAADRGAAILAVPAHDTVKRVAKGKTIAETIPREVIWLAQTPQVVAYELLCRALAHAETNGMVGTDEAALVEALNESVTVVPATGKNMKITTPEDLVIAQAMMAQKGWL